MWLLRVFLCLCASVQKRLVLHQLCEAELRCAGGSGPVFQSPVHPAVQTGSGSSGRDVRNHRQTHTLIHGPPQHTLHINNTPQHTLHINNTHSPRHTLHINNTHSTTLTCTCKNIYTLSVKVLGSEGILILGSES